MQLKAYHMFREEGGNILEYLTFVTFGCYL